MGQPVAELQSLIGGDRNGTDSFWKRGGSCVDVRSVFNRYQSFTYANPSNCN